MFGGVTRNGIATGASIDAGPRDGRMTGIAARGRSLPVVRSAIGLTVLGAGWLLGGTAGIGTVVDVVAIGALAHVFIALFTAHPAPARPSVTSPHRSPRPARIATKTPGPRGSKKVVGPGASTSTTGTVPYALMSAPRGGVPSPVEKRLF